MLGNHIKIDSYSRLDENMPTFRVELITPTAVFFMQQEAKLHALSSFCALSNICMPEFQELEAFYNLVSDFFTNINTADWLKYYAFFEFHLLDFLGIGLDLSECSATGTTQNLAYVSPKTGKAVCQEAGEAYKNRLYLYPSFIVDKSISPEYLAITDALKMTSFFLNKNFFAVHGLKFPKCRDNLASNIYSYTGTKQE